jgi:hypothetical protein
MRELRPGVWDWQALHPEWSEEQWWPELVSSHGVELGDDLVLFDPLSVPDELRERATAIVLTAPYHERDARRLGLPVHTPPADTWEDWVEKFGVEPDRVRGMESEDLAWLRAGEGEGHFHGPGAWPFGISGYAGREDNDLIFWLPSVSAIVTGDTLSDFGDGLDVQLGGRKHVTREDVVKRLRRADSAEEDFLVLHGECVARIEDKERPLRQWDFFHCAPGTRHGFTGSGDYPCVLLMVGSRAAGRTLDYPEQQAKSSVEAYVGYPEWRPGPRPNPFD